MGISNIVIMGPNVDFDDGRIGQLPIGAAIANATPTTVIPAVSGKRIFVLSMFVSANNNNTFNIIETTAAGATVTTQNAIVGSTMGLLANAPMVLPYQQFPWFTCAAGNALSFSSQAGQTIFTGGRVTYIQA